MKSCKNLPAAFRVVEYLQGLHGQTRVFGTEGLEAEIASDNDVKGYSLQYRNPSNVDVVSAAPAGPPLQLVITPTEYARWENFATEVGALPIDPETGNPA